MRDTDVRIVDASVVFREVELAHPFAISGRVISWFTVAEITVDVESHSKRTASGTGATILSVPWAWPTGISDITGSDRTLRELVERLAASAVGREPTDPIELWRALEDELPHDVPRLAALLTLGGLDNAVHDAWARAAGRSVFEMYGIEHLAADLGWLDPKLAGQYPGEFLGVSDVTTLPVQHLVGAGDPLTPDYSAAGERSLTDWLAADGPIHLKIKVAADDPTDDARRVSDVMGIARRKTTRSADIRIAVDPNEGYHEPEQVGRFLDELQRLSPSAAAALRYVEQPVPRNMNVEPERMRRVSSRIPVLLDEGFTDISLVAQLEELGWSGVVIKAAKGQTPAILANAVMKARGQWVAIQDLTAVDLAFVHSARLVSALAPTSRHLEYNSRQYAPRANDDLAASRPELAVVRDGYVTYPLGESPGLYQFDGAVTRPGAPPSA